jgi:hypothetical protein
MPKEQSFGISWREQVTIDDDYDVHFVLVDKNKNKNKKNNQESIRDASAELQVKIIWSCFINK